jgi:hypothetical protein
VNVRGFFATLSVILLSLALVSSGCKREDARDSHDQKENKGDITKSPPAESTGTRTDAALDRTRPIPGNPAQEQIVLLPARTFQSDLPFRVVTHTTQEELLEWDGFMRGTAVGHTGPGQIIEIPPCRFWFVAPTDPDPNWEMTAAEVARRNAPGLHVSRATDVDLSHLASLKHLTYLAISDSDNVTDAGLEAIADLTNLQMLVLSNCDNITDSGLKNLEDLERIQMLFLNCTRLTGGGLVHVRNLKDLRVLWADYNNTEPYLEHVEDLEELQALILIEAKTTDAGLEHLKTLKNLERLALESANITDAGLEHLKALENLKMLYFDSAQCSDAAVESLQKALPNCEISRQ